MAMVDNPSTAGSPQAGQGRRHVLAGLATLAGAVVLVSAVIFGLTAGVGAIWSSVTAGPAPAQVASAQGMSDMVASAHEGNMAPSQGAVPGATGVPATTGTAASSTTAASAGTTAPPAASTNEKSDSDAAHLAISLTIKNIKTPGGQQPAYIGPNGVGAATLFSVTAGQTVTVSVKNEDSGFHTFTDPTLGLAVTIKPLSTTTFTFRPAAAGSYPWKCEIPCGGWVMSHAGYMTGAVDVSAAK